MAQPGYIWFTASCPNCGDELTNLKYPRELWEAPLLSGSPTFSCPGCQQQVSVRQESGPGDESRLVVSMHTLPVGTAMPPDTVARRADPPAPPQAGAPPATIDEMFERIVEPWRDANRDDEPDFAALAKAVEPYPPKWRGVAWQDVGRSGPLGRDPTGWVRGAQCYVEALRHNSDPNFLGWSMTIGGYRGPDDPPREPEADALNKRMDAREQLDDAGRVQLVEDLRRYVGGPGDPAPGTS